MNSLRFEKVSFGYGQPVFNGLDLAFEPGRWHALIGPNASGKTSLLRLATGLARPAVGRVYLGNDPVDSLRPSVRARKLAVVPQFETNVFPLTVRKLVAAGRHCRQQGFFAGEPDAVVDRVLSRVGAGHLAGRSVWDLSGGERQRVLVARALAQEADWLLLDEATTFLDLRAEFELLRLLAELRGEGLSILSVTHDLQAASRADRVTLLSGDAAVQGTPAGILTEERLSRAFGAPKAREIGRAHV